MHVLLSTYEGSRFLRTQLESLAAQNFPDWVLLWRDDGSTDNTVELLEAFGASRPPGHCIPVDQPPGRIGITASFLTLLRRVPPGCPAAFADQDDVWLPDKLRRGETALRALPPDRPALYFSRQRLIDAAGRSLGLSPLVEAAMFPAALTQNIATGCTVMLNPAAVALVARSTPPPGTLHDWWSYLLVSAADGILVADPEPTVLYRQHAGNAVGAPHSMLRRASMALRRGPDAFMRLFRAHVAALARNDGLIPEHTRRDLVQLNVALDGAGWRRLAGVVHISGLRRRTTPETVLFWIWFLFG